MVKSNEPGLYSFLGSICFFFGLDHLQDKVRERLFIAVIPRPYVTTETNPFCDSTTLHITTLGYKVRCVFLWLDSKSTCCGISSSVFYFLLLFKHRQIKLQTVFHNQHRQLCWQSPARSSFVGPERSVTRSPVLGSPSISAVCHTHSYAECKSVPLWPAGSGS